MVFYIHRLIDGELLATAFYPSVPLDLNFTHPFTDLKFVHDFTTTETIVMAAEPLFVMTNLLGMDSPRDCFVKCFTISKKSCQIPELLGRKVSGLKQRFLVLKPEYKKYQVEIFKTHVVGKGFGQSQTPSPT